MDATASNKSAHAVAKPTKVEPKDGARTTTSKSNLLIGMTPLLKMANSEKVTGLKALFKGTGDPRKTPTEHLDDFLTKPMITVPE